MSFVELQIPPKALLEVFEAKGASTGMTRAVPGGATLTVGGLEKHSYGALPLVPVIVTLGSAVAIHLLSSWLYDKLKRANVRHIRIKGVEIEVTAEGITKAISESIDTERRFMAPDDEGQEKPLIQQSLQATAVSEAQIVSSNDAIICLRVPPDADMEQYVQGSAIQNCSLCQSGVLVAPSTQMILAQGENQIVCMECWTQAQPPEMSPEERENKLRQLEICQQAGEQAYDDMYEKAHHPSDATAYFSDAKESFHTAIELARELGLEQEIEKLEKRLAHIKAIFRSQFS
jgi:hypothetical protein